MMSESTKRRFIWQFIVIRLRDWIFANIIKHYLYFLQVLAAIEELTSFTSRVLKTGGPSLLYNAQPGMNLRTISDPVTWVAKPSWEKDYRPGIVILYIHEMLRTFFFFN